ncbi:hypothetical protein IAR55_004553 [Kwoniella newhampshirensis]|uniref:Uncharacterized protein n=1 Tax=Kwoniella newhampshirensis TaxID=1651941 RepID=A0AAW0YXV9_9TREE
MSSQDVRSILNLPQAGPSQGKRALPAVKKPDGISRELYALIGDNAPSLAEVQASLAAVKYRERPGLRKKVKCPHTSHLASKHPIHQPVYLRSTKLPLPKPTAAIRITELLNELGISAHKLVMPTRGNLEIFESLLQAASALIDMKRQVDRVEQELRTVRAQREGLVPFERKVRSDSIASTDTTTTNRRSRGL